MKWKDLQLRYADPRMKDVTSQLKSQILDVLKAINGHGSISISAMDNLCCMVMHVIDQILSEADDLRQAHHVDKEYITENDIAKALQMLIGGQTYQLLAARAEYVCKVLKEHKAEKQALKRS